MEEDRVKTAEEETESGRREVLKKGAKIRPIPEINNKTSSSSSQHTCINVLSMYPLFIVLFHRTYELYCVIL